jgi:uncharacterized protein involved in exopolysaccharide biosynthesis
MSKNKNISNDASNNDKGADDSLQKRNLPVSSLQKALDYGYSRTNEKNVFDYAALISRHWFLILAFIVIGVCYAAYYNNTAQKIYRSSALVNIGTYVPPVDGPTGDTLRSETLKSNYISTQARLLKSFTLAEKSLRSNPHIRTKFDGEFAKTQNGKSPVAVSVMDSYLSTIVFDTIPNTTLVQVHAHTNDSKLSAEIANTHVRAFIELVRERTKEAAYTNLSYLKEKLEEANKKVEAVEKKRLAYIKENKLNIIGTEMTDQVFTQKHNGLVQSLSSAINERNTAESNFLTARNMHGLDEDITYQTLEIAKLESQLSNYLTDGGDRFSRFYTDISKQIQALKAGIKAYGKQKLDLAREKYSSSTSKERRLN